jgi:small nuclear ribonucleoprotein (snRNP)-like protein
MAQRKNPADFLKLMLGQTVEVKLNDNHTFFTGRLACLDGTMNVLLTHAQEVVQGQPANSFKEVFLRGNNVLYIKRT